MKTSSLRLPDGLFSVFTLLVTFALSLLIQQIFRTQSLIPMVFVLGIFLIALRTQGYFWGVSASLASVLAVNYAFTFPYYAIDLISPTCVFSALVMLIVAIVTSTLTTQIKVQEKIKAEIERERMRANLLRAVSHDLRTPLTTILGSSSTLLENYELLSHQQKKKLLREVRDDAQWLIRMVENLLSVTRIDEGGKVQLSKHPAVLEELVDIMLVKFRKHCPDTSVTVEIPENFVTIPMDVMLIQQVLMNLLENAVDHAHGMTKLILRVTVCDNQAVFSVIDNGCGIPPERLKDLFTGRIGPVDSPVDGTRHNMGIGLSVCAAIIKAHGSEITAKNNPDGGATFSFSLGLEDNYE
ncbi:MAG: DUF4118 domain-containing protein [Oscillospiraceae bacterium]|nr:DUF4118 domain-containing protein [Oscillospiraceae bacterium]